MGREVKRVALDFDWPLDKVWGGFLNPHYAGHCQDCSVCGGSGYSADAKRLQGLWYGHIPFKPEMTGSTPFSETDAIVRARAEANIGHSPEYYGTRAIVREAVRLAELFNARWIHHLDADDVAALIEGDRLWDLTQRNPHAPEGYVPTPSEVNQWSICGFGHDAINCCLVIKAKCGRLGLPYLCSACNGDGSIWDSPENKRIAEEWQQEEPPSGEGWQVWETVSEGSPITPVFPSAEALILHLAEKGDAWDQKRGDPGWGIERASAFVKAGWVFSVLGTPDGRILEPRDIALELSE